MERSAAVEGDELVLCVMRGIKGLSPEAVETLAWAVCQDRIVVPGEMARMLGLDQRAVRKRCVRLTKRGWLAPLGDGSYELGGAVRVDVELLLEACGAGDETAAVALGQSVAGRAFAQVNAEWLDDRVGAQSYREIQNARIGHALDSGVEAFPDHAAVFEAASNRLYGD